MSQQDVTVTPVRVYTQVGTDRDLTLGTEHRTRVQRAYFTVEGAPVVTLYGLRGDCVIRLVAVSWDMGMPLPSVNVTVRNGVVPQQAAAATWAWVCDMRAERAA